MRITFPLIALAVMSVTNMYGQGNHVHFTLSENFSFVRADSEQNYYVFDYGSSLDAQDLSVLFHNKWDEVRNLPEYFDYPFRDSFFDVDSGTLEGTTPDYSTIFGPLALRYKVLFKFKDGRVRVDPPSTTVLLRDCNVPHPEKTPSAFCHMSVGAFQNKENAEAQKRLFLEQITNAIINEYISYVEFEDTDWETPHEYVGLDDEYFTLGNKFKFEYPDESNRMVFKVPGLSKKQLKELFSNSLNRMNEGGINIDFDSNFNENAIYLWGIEKIKYAGLLSPQTYTLHYRCYYIFEDEMIKVFVPKIYQVNTYFGDKPYQYNSLGEALWMMSVCKKDGTHNSSKKAVAFIDNLNEIMNSLVFAPIQLITASLEKKVQQEEDW